MLDVCYTVLSSSEISPEELLLNLNTIVQYSSLKNIVKTKYHSFVLFYLRRNENGI